MTHIPDCDKESGRRGKAVAICGAVISVRKMKTATAATCPLCREFDEGCTEAMIDICGISGWASLQIDRRAFILAGRSMKRKRRRK